MVETSIVLSLVLPAFLLIYTAFQLGDEHSVLKMLLASTGLTFLLGVPFTGYKFALANGYGKIAGYLIYFELGLVVTFVMFVFYQFWLYIKSASKAVSGKNDSFEDGETGV